ncbi:hypothetical protein J0H58_34765 [bacterium]|nr:hypothetical protein [bacterium]
MTDAARTELLRRLPRDGFLPAEDAAPWSRAGRCAAFAADVEAFAAGYWAMPPAERRARFNALWNARYGPAAGRLGLLEDGLDVAGDGRAATTHAGLVRELEVIRHQAVAARLDEMRARTIMWPVPAPVARTDAAPERPVEELPAFDEYRLPRRPSGAPYADLWYANGLFLLGLAAAGLIGLAVLVYANFPGRFPETPGTPLPFTAREVRDFQSYHDGLRDGKPYRPQPARYGEWLRAGKPGARVPE